jgi:hypothetical protein
MQESFGYTALRARLRTSLNHRETVLGWFRVLRYALVQGPWRSWLIRRYEARNANPPIPVHDDTLFDGLDPPSVGRLLDEEACAGEFLVPGGVVDEIVTWSREVGAKRIDDPHVDCAGVQRIANDPRIVAVARRYLGAEPILFTSKIYWTVPPPDVEGRLRAAAERGQFHYDVADVKALTVFVYLTDVDENSGPHVVIRGTQRRVTPMQVLRRTISDEFASRTFAGRIQAITGPRGTGWFEDITCYHKQAAGSNVRLMLSIIYSLHRRPIEDLARRTAAACDSRPADRLRLGSASRA